MSNTPWYYITAVQLSASGGQTTHIIEVCRVLAQRRPTTLLAPVAPPASIPELGVQVVPLPKRPPREIIFQTRVLATVLRPPRSQRPHVLYVRAASFNMGAILAARRLGIPVVLEVNGLRGFEYRMQNQNMQGHARFIFYTLLERLEHRLADGVAVVTTQLAAIARRNGARNVYQTMNGVNLALFAPQDKQAARQSAGLPIDAEIVGFSGSFTVWQGLDTLIRAVALLRPQRPNLHLLLIGDGEERPTLEHLAQPLGAHAHFTGSLPHQEVARTLAASDVLAAPFAPIERNRRMGISALKLGEYMALGRPILGSRLPGMEFVDHYQVGALFEPGNPAALAQQLAALLDMPPDKRAAMEHRARSTAEQRFSWERITDDLIAFVEQL